MLCVVVVVGVFVGVFCLGIVYVEIVKIVWIDLLLGLMGVLG